MIRYNDLSKEELIKLLEERDCQSRQKQVQNLIDGTPMDLSEFGGKLNMIFNNMPVGIELYDREGYLVTANNTDLEIFESTMEDMKGVNLFNNPNLTKEQEYTIRNSKSSFFFPLAYNFKKARESGYYHPSSNSIKHLQVKGLSLQDPELGHLGYLFFFIDYTDTVLNTELLKNNLAMAKAILLNGHSMIGEYDWEKEAIYIDPKLNDHSKDCTLFKLLNGNLLYFGDIYQGSSIDEKEKWTQNPFRKVLQGMEDQCSFDCEVTIGDHSTWIRFNAVAYKGEQEKTPKIICYFVDVTEEKYLETQLKVTQEKSRQAELEKLKAQEADRLKSAFIANMSHEIRTPLNSIVGFSNLLMETEVKEEMKMFIDIINTNNDLLLRLITDILDFSKIEANALECDFDMTNFKEIITSQYKLHSLKMQEGISFICDVDALPDVMIYTDSKRITQVLSNLISNARKFTETGSISLSYRKEGDFLITEVTDTGSGIALDQQTAIFDRFVKLNSFQQGTGLGLTICKMIIETLHGSIGVNSTPGVGSCFWFTLPCGK